MDLMCKNLVSFDKERHCEWESEQDVKWSICCSVGTVHDELVCGLSGCNPITCLRTLAYLASSCSVLSDLFDIIYSVLLLCVRCIMRSAHSLTMWARCVHFDWFKTLWTSWQQSHLYHIDLRLNRPMKRLSSAPLSFGALYWLLYSLSTTLSHLSQKVMWGW